MSNWNTWEKLFFYMMIIQGNGITAIVNTGPPREPELSQINRVNRAIYGGDRGSIIAREEERPWVCLPKIGIDANKVDFVIVTPLQSYAISNVDMFPNAKICLSKRGWLDFHAPKFVHGSRQLAIPDKTLIYLETVAWNRLRLLEDEDTIAPGIRVFWTGVHHRSTIAVCVETKKGTVIFSDCFFKYDNIEKNRPLGIQESMLAYERIGREGKILIPPYDPEVLKRHPQGEIA
jgi:hypothetical protein